LGALETDFDRGCFRVLPAERFSLSRLLKFPFRSNFQQGQSVAYCGTGVAMATAFGRQAAAFISGEPLPPFLTMDFPPVPLYRGTPWFLPAVGLYYQWRDATT